MNTGGVTEALLEEWPVRALEATLDRTSARAVTEELPPLWHWLYFLGVTPRSRLGIDGHPALESADGGAPMRRMFAAARLELHRPLRIGVRAEMRETLLHSRDTVGSSGPLRIVTHQYVYRQEGRDCIVEQRDIVYLPGAAAPGVGSAAAPAPAAAAPDWSDTITPDPVMLFRFSALTFNAHRIHYDQQYAQKVEGHRERVVHGPLTALLLAESVRERRAERLQRFEFRARRPLFVDQPVKISGRVDGREVRLSAQDPAGAAAMEAVATLATAGAVPGGG